MSFNELSASPASRPMPDRRGLEHLRQRFLTLNAGRLARAHQLLSTRQQRVLHLLPLLFHVNHPGLPGYVSTNTPAGLSEYEPSPTALNEARLLARSFRYWALPQNTVAPLHGLFLMGSLGTLAQAEGSDMDLWLCHDPALDEASLDLLRRKARAVENWAASLGADLHVFLVDPARFSSGRRDAELSGEDCGSSQHYLLLDEFFRTAVWLGGRTPTWWLVPADQEERYPEYVASLRASGLLSADQELEFGYLGQVPVHEYLGSGVWQLYKAMQSPYKSVLKLLLNEAYADAHPGGACLALEFKRDVLAGETDLDELDPYIRLYRRLASYLRGRGDEARLELVRRCLYLKINRPLSRPMGCTWQRQLLQQLCAGWGWDERRLVLLDSRPRWKLRQVEAERRLLVAALLNSYLSLKQFAEHQQAMNAMSERDMRVLGRRLRVLFARSAAKIDTVNPGIVASLAEPNLTLRRLEPEQWALYDGSLTAAQCEDRSPLKRSRHLVALLAWAQRNGVLDTASRVTLHPGHSDLRDFELQGMRAVLQTLPTPQVEVPDAVMLQRRCIERVIVLINVGLDPLQGLSQLKMAGGRGDVLDYTGSQVSLVQSLDCVTLSSWNEVLHQRYEGTQAISECLGSLLGEGVQAHRVQFHCFAQNRAQALAQRLQGLYAQAFDVLCPANERLLVRIAGHYRIWQRCDGQLTERAIPDLGGLLAYLATAQSVPLRLDTQSLANQTLGLVLQHAELGCLQVFYQVGESTQVYLLDECNALWRDALPGRAETVLPLLQYFLEALMNSTENRPAKLGRGPVRYYQLLPGAPLAATELVRRLPPNAEPGSLPLSACVHRDAQQCDRITLYCGWDGFHQQDHGPRLYAALASEMRARGKKGPLMLTELQLSGLYEAGHVQTAHYLEYKRRIERELQAEPGLS